MGPGKRPQVEPTEDGVPELDEAQRQPVATGLGHVLDVAGRSEGRQQARDRARVDPGAARDLVRAELLPVAERVDHREGAFHGSNVADSWLTGAGRGTLHLLVFDT